MSFKVHKIRLKPNNKQVAHFRQSCGVARFAYNWALGEWQKQYKNGEKPNEGELRKQFNAIKRELFPFVMEVTKYAPQRAIMNLGVAFKRFFKKLSGYPNFKKKGTYDKYYIGNDHLEVRNNAIKLPKIGWVRMYESLRFEGKLMSATVSRRADKWFVSICVEVQDDVIPLVEVTRIDEFIKSENQATNPTGIDMGLKKFLVLADGTTIENPRFLKQFEKKIKRANKRLSRKIGSKKGQTKSNNFKKATLKLQRIYGKLVDVRDDFLHKTTNMLCRKYDLICLEDLNVKGMVRNKHLSKALLDACFGEFRRQVCYKATAVNFVGRFDPTTKVCSRCGHHEDMTLADRTFQCSECGLVMDRDLNAAINILDKGQKSPCKILRRVLPKVKSVEKKPLAIKRNFGNESLSTKQKLNTEPSTARIP